jgi:hypothetical protein
MDTFERWLKIEQIREETGREVQFASLHVMSFQFAYYRISHPYFQDSPIRVVVCVLLAFLSFL